MKDKKVDIILDYWMYNIILRVLKKERNNLIKKYSKGYERFINNKFVDIGQIELSIKKIQEMQEKHDELIKRDLNE